MEATLAQEKEASVIEGSGGVDGERGLLVMSTFVGVVTFVEVGWTAMAESLRSRERARGMLLDAIVRGLR